MIVDERLARFDLYARIPRPRGSLNGTLAVLLTLSLPFAAMLSPFVACGIFGGVALQRVLRPGYKRNRIEVTLDLAAILLAAFALVAQPVYDAIRDAQLNSIIRVFEDLLNDAGNIAAPTPKSQGHMI